ncbi:PTS sugar transporter subunit IIA [Nitrosomonas mobilis]|uniref:PTS EIIA type-4 domain-containing protein n=1 Tax=Nitrosomonas mobilis TaxID=51642 RepID=A0A1G5SCI2_9PROT|nr:PTS sugar transporter subunit IIA [Nitrosomonas mobilis]SCZ84530.1 conserved hypothetical protein [Nitrosomonas mobilis]HNO75534.1 PTS sugar transporter subunit IIA [Nitrosomonas mobilis]
MIGILIVTHQPLGSSFLDCIEHILGKLPPLLINYTITPQADPDKEIANLQTILPTLDQGSGVLILTDLYGATPANIASKLLQDGKVECLTGLNLPMLLRAAQYQNQPLMEMIDKVLSGGQTGIFRVPAPPKSHAN